MTEKKIIFFEGDDNTDNITRKGVVESLNMNGISEYCLLYTSDAADE